MTCNPDLVSHHTRVIEKAESSFEEKAGRWLIAGTEVNKISGEYNKVASVLGPKWLMALLPEHVQEALEPEVRDRVAGCLWHYMQDDVLTYHEALMAAAYRLSVRSLEASAHHSKTPPAPSGFDPG